MNICVIADTFIFAFQIKYLSGLEPLKKLVIFSLHNYSDVCIASKLKKKKKEMLVFWGAGYINHLDDTIGEPSRERNCDST